MHIVDPKTNIFTVSRKCPFCRHISKSPAMLEKHIFRHVQDCLKSGNQYSCLKCNYITVDNKEIFEHLKRHQQEVVESLISSKTDSESTTASPKMIQKTSLPSSPSSSTSTPTSTLSAPSMNCDTNNIMKCDYCIYSTDNFMNLNQHKLINHQMAAWQQLFLNNPNIFNNVNNSFLLTNFK